MTARSLVVDFSGDGPNGRRSWPQARPGTWLTLTSSRMNVSCRTSPRWDGGDHAAFGVERGSVTILAVVWVGLLCLITAAGLCLIGIWDARARAEAAADLGALAGAGRLLDDSDEVCAAARQVVLANRASLVDCEVSGLDVRVVAAVPMPRGLPQISLGLLGETVPAQAHSTITGLARGP